MQAATVFEQRKPMWQVLLVFLIPLVLSNALQSLSQTTSSIYLGRLIGVDALAAVSALFPIVFFLISFLIGLSSGATVLIGQAYGARDEHRMKEVVGTVLTVTLILGVTVGVLGAVFTYPLLRLVGTPANIIEDSVVYSRIFFWILPVFFVYIAYTTFLRGTGDSKTPFYFLIVSTAISMIVTPWLIEGWLGAPKLGIASAAISGLVANVVSLSALLIYLSKIRHPLRFDRETMRDMRVHWPILKATVRIGIPTAIQVVTVALAEVAVITFVNRFGSDATAAYGAVNQVVGYVQFPAISIGIASSIFGAQAIGAQRQDLLGSVIRSGVTLNYVVSAAIIGVCYIFAWEILGWFITEKHALDIAHSLLMITLWSYMVFGNTSVLSGIMRSSGTVLWPTVIGVFSIACVEVPAAYLLMHRFGVDGIWMGYPMAFCCGLLLQFLYYEFFWKHRTHQRLI